MKILITGATGFLGSALCNKWRLDGHVITAFVRDQHKAKLILGPDISLVDNFNNLPKTSAFDAIVNLAGAPIAGGLWTKKYRQTLLDSRLITTKALVELVARLEKKPSVFISASAAGYYGRQGPEPVEENCLPQDIFMSELCKRWEDEAAAVQQYGVRLVIPRISVVLGTDGGAFPAMVRPHRFGLGATIGSGGQYFPWIHKEDLVRFFDFCLKNQDIRGPINCAAPGATTQREFNKCIAEQLARPMFMKIPAFAFRLPLGDMADLFTEGQNMSPKKALEHGFKFSYPTLQEALGNLL